MSARHKGVRTNLLYIKPRSQLIVFIRSRVDPRYFRHRGTLEGLFALDIGKEGFEWENVSWKLAVVVLDILL